MLNDKLCGIWFSPRDVYWQNRDAEKANKQWKHSLILPNDDIDDKKENIIQSF